MVRRERVVCGESMGAVVVVGWMFEDGFWRWMGTAEFHNRE